MRVHVHAPGPVRHGVVRHAALVERLTRRHGVVAACRGADVSHAQFTDAIFGPDIESATAAFEAWAAAATRPLVVTLHDVPGSDPDPLRDARRSRGYARVAAAADAVIVSAAHEAENLVRSTGHVATVIPLPVETLPPGGVTPGWAGRPSLAVLGFVYPGKGHAEAIEAAGRCAVPPLVVALGAVADGHEDLHRELSSVAAERRVEFLVTGSLSDADLAAAASAATVPLAPARRVSASGSLGTWIGCGRVPIAARGAYTAALHPFSLRLYDTDAELDAAVAHALDDPAVTRAAPPIGPDVGAAHAALYRALLGAPC